VARVAVLLTALTAVVTPGWSWSSLACLAGLMLTAVMTVRLGFQAWVDGQRTLGRFTIPVLVVGHARERTALIEMLSFHPETGLRVVGVVGDRSDHGGAMPDGGPPPPWFGTLEAMPHALMSSGAVGVIVVTSGLRTATLNGLLRQLVDAGMHVQLWSGVFGLGPERLHLAPVAHEPLLAVESPRMSLGEQAFKRILDVSVAAVVLVFAAPIIAVSALAIRLSDGGPALFRQERVGRDGRTFTLLKLRTMELDAEAQLVHLQEWNQRTGGPLFKLDDDPRITRVGQVLRVTSIDELPQLWNVIRGDLSLVGPRPALPDEAARFDTELLKRQQVRPGITGLWQIEARSNPAFYLYRQLDLYYVENRSTRLDLGILLATVPAVLGPGIRGIWGLLSGRNGREETTDAVRYSPIEGPPSDLDTDEIAV
jgi:exopolysaccharide biosynthesis polyprenyl glycosylphosphotransferase